jgi:hypothetical protein
MRVKAMVAKWEAQQEVVLSWAAEELEARQDKPMVVAVDNLLLVLLASLFLSSNYVL